MVLGPIQIKVKEQKIWIKVPGLNTLEVKTKEMNFHKFDVKPQKSSQTSV